MSVDHSLTASPMGFLYIHPRVELSYGSSYQFMQPRLTCTSFKRVVESQPRRFKRMRSARKPETGKSEKHIEYGTNVKTGLINDRL